MISRRTYRRAAKAVAPLLATGITACVVTLLFASGLLVAGLLVAGPLAADDAFGPRATWQAPAEAEVRAELFAWLDEKQLAKSARREIETLWPEEGEAAEGDLLERLVAAFAVADPRCRALAEECAEARRGVHLPDTAWLLDPQTPPLVAHNLRLYYARWLAHHDLYDEALRMAGELQPEQVVDPAALLFFQAVAHHRLVQAKESQTAARRLLEREEELPARYRQVARLMAEVLKGLKDESLDHIARRMADIRRRLDLGRAGEKVIAVEEGVIDSLDKLIEEMEAQQKKQQQSPGSAGQQSGKPMQDSRIATQKGPGNVQKRDVGSGSGWGDLPPKEREEALQQVGRDFPAHYRDAIEQYFRKLANDEGVPPR